jgi:hypothetical protein
MHRILAVFFSAFICTGIFAATPEQLSLARDVVKAMNLEKMVGAQMSHIPPKSMSAAERIVTERAEAAAMESMRECFRAMERSYAEAYSEAELRAMKVFFSSPEWREIQDGAVSGEVPKKG